MNLTELWISLFHDGSHNGLSYKGGFRYITVHGMMSNYTHIILRLMESWRYIRWWSPGSNICEYLFEDFASSSMTKFVSLELSRSRQRVSLLELLNGIFWIVWNVFDNDTDITEELLPYITKELVNTAIVNPSMRNI